MMKILHILSNHKFADIHIARFESSGFDDSYVFLAERFDYDGRYRDKLRHIVPFSPAFYDLKDTASLYDLIIVYHLDYPKSFLVNRIPKNIRVIWHLYGTELYNEYGAFKYAIYSDRTKAILRMGSWTVLKDKTKRILSRLKYRLLNRVATYNEIHAAILRTNYLAWYSPEEYHYLQSGLDFKLPEFLYTPVIIKEAGFQPALQSQQSHLLLGNSASPENNHTDIIAALEALEYRGKIVIPFSYNHEKKYEQHFRQILQKSALQIELLEEFLDYDTYAGLMNCCGLAVFNSYRQLALGNIFLALNHNVKVYLNEKNPSYTWLLNCGFNIFSVQNDFEADIKNGQLFLKPSQAGHNRDVYKKMTSPENNRLFFQQLNEIILNRAKNSSE